MFSSPDVERRRAEEYKGVRVFEFWARPSTDYPQRQALRLGQRPDARRGRRALRPDALRRCSSGIKAPDRFWPTAITTQLRGPQVELNKLMRQIAENAAAVRQPGADEVPAGQRPLLGRPRRGDPLRLDRPRRRSLLPAAPGDALLRPRADRADRRPRSTEISGMHEVSKATVPTGVTAASAINLLQEADDTRIGPEIQDMEVALGAAGTKMLKLRASYNTDERLIRIAGEDGNWDIFGFRGRCLVTNPTSRSRPVPLDAALEGGEAGGDARGPRARLPVRARVRPPRPAPVLQGLRGGGLERLFESICSDESQVQRENRMMLRAKREYQRLGRGRNPRRRPRRVPQVRPLCPAPAAHPDHLRHSRPRPQGTPSSSCESAAHGRSAGRARARADGAGASGTGGSARWLRPRRSSAR